MDKVDLTVIFMLRMRDALIYHLHHGVESCSMRSTFLDWGALPIPGALRSRSRSQIVVAGGRIDEGHLTSRACLFDDENVFNADGSFQNVQGAETFVEPWQGNDPEGCAAPVAPHDGSATAAWSADMECWRGSRLDGIGGLSWYC